MCFGVYLYRTLHKKYPFYIEVMTDIAARLLNVTKFRAIVLKAKLVRKITPTVRKNIFVNCLTLMLLMKL